MKILNIMLSRELGGIQQAFLDYNLALKLGGFQVINITSLYAKINQLINSDYKLINIGPWDILSTIYLTKIIQLTKPQIIIGHGNRAINFANLAKTKSITLIGIAHNYSLKGLKKCDKVIALTEDMREFLIKNNFAPCQIQIIPNMINIDTPPIFKKKYQKPVVIGAIGRFVPKKGIDIFLHSLAKLKKLQYNLKAIIGGNGEEQAKLLSLSKNLGLDSDVTFIDWVKDKQQFFNEIDIFCLPSLHEPFGIILLEAMRFNVPIISTKTEGPKEIIRDKIDGLLCEIGSSDDLASKIAYLIDHQDVAEQLAKSSYLRLTENYQTNIVATKLANYIRSLV